MTNIYGRSNQKKAGYDKNTHERNKYFLLVYLSSGLKYNQSLPHFQIVVHKLICKLSVHIFFLNFPVHTMLWDWSFYNFFFHANVITSREDITIFYPNSSLKGVLFLIS